MEAPGIYAREAPSLEAVVQVGYASGTVISVSFPASMPDDAEAEHALLDRIDAYLEGSEESFRDVAVALSVATDRSEVLETVRGIPYGEEVDVAQLARMTPGLDAEDDDDLRAVREALADNPAPLIVPDHRVRDGPGAAPAGVEQTLRHLERL